MRVSICTGLDCIERVVFIFECVTRDAEMPRCRIVNEWGTRIIECDFKSRQHAFHSICRRRGGWLSTVVCDSIDVILPHCVCSNGL